ncbi:MAG: hypothetical protein IT529_16130 [Burkholderiales bacterium]|nr:hypothetical protein [Burkholderiales bacterium]
MRKPNVVEANTVIQQRLGETVMNPYARSRALEMLRGAETFADTIVWVKDRIASIGACFLKPGLKH